MPATTTKVAYATSVGFTITLNSLGSTSARQSTAIDNTTNLYLDALCRVTVNVGAVAGSPQALIYAFGSEDGTTYPDTIGATDAAVTLESPTVLRLADVIPTPTGSKAYESDVFSIARLYGYLPRKWGIVVSNQTGAAFAGSGCSASYTGITLTSS